VNRRVIGVLNVESKRPDAFDEEDEQFLITVAGSLGTALERLRLFKEEQRRAKELNALYQATKPLTQSLQPNVIAENLLGIMDELLGYEFASIHLLDRQSQSLVPLAISQKANDLTYEKDMERLRTERPALGEGIVGWVAQHGRAIRSGDVSREERYLPVTKNIASELCVPLISRGSVIGAINIETTIPHAYSERDENLLTALANSAAIALENATLYGTELVRREQAETLQTVTASISTSLDSNTLYRIILDSLTKLVQHDSASIFLERENDEMEIVAARGFNEVEKIVGRRLPKTAKWHELALNRKALVMADAQVDPRFEKWEASGKIRGWLGIPMIAQDQVIGFINLDSHKVNAFTERDATLVQTFANSAAVAIQNARLFASVQEQVQREATLLDLLRVTTSSLELEDVMFTILGHMIKLIPSDSGTIQLLEGDQLRVAAAIGFESNQTFVGKALHLNDFPINRQAIESKYPVVINEAIKKSEFVLMKEAGEVNSFLAIPLIFKGEAIGLATLDSNQTARFTKEDANFGFMIANHAAIALGNARLYQDAVRASERRAILHRISQDIIRFTQDSEKIYAAIHEAAGKLMPCDVFLIALQDELKHEIVSVYAVEKGQRYAPKNVPAHKGFTAGVINSGESLILRDESEIAKRNVVRFGSPKRVQSVVAIPMRIGGRIIGMISAQCYQPYAYGEEEQALLEMLATHAATAIENARLFESEQKRRQEAENLRQAATAISSTLDLNNVLEDILKALNQVISYNSASVFLLEGSWLRLAICQGFSRPEELINQKFPATDELFQMVRVGKSPLIIEDVKKDSRFHNWGDTSRVRGWMATPLVARGEVIGYITLDSHEPGAYSETLSETAMAFANQAAAAIENARLYDETQRRLQEMEMINRVSTSLRMTQSQDEMLDIFLDETLGLLKAEHGSVWLYDHSTHTLIQRAARGVARRVKYNRLKPGEGIISHVFQSGEVYTTPDLKNDPLIFKPNLDVILPGYGGACIPIKSTSGTLGALMIQMESSRQITEHINLLTTLAEIIGNAIHRAELFEQSLEQVRRLTTLRDIDSAIASSTDLRVTLNIMTDHTLKHLKVDAVDIMLYHPELQSLTYLTSAGFNTPSPSRPLIRIGEGLAGQVVMKGRTDHVTDLKNSSEVKRDPMLLREGFVTYIGVPLIVKGQIKGVFEVFHRAALSPNVEWMQFLHTLAGQAAIAIDNAQLFDNLQRSNQELTQAYDTTLEGWARALELRDRETEGHTRRVTDLTLRLARYMGLGDDELVNIYRGVLLHDIGKMGVPDHILKKTGSLTEAEWAEMRRHPQYAFDLLSPIPYLRTALDIPYNHHEHWDGGGYPRGLKGEQIPLSARIFSIVDIWDALLSDRPYRKAWPRKKVIEYLKDVSGQILDPKVVEAFMKMISDEESRTG
jgi:GAF domain-containing protein